MDGHVEPLRAALFLIAGLAAAGIVHMAWLRSAWSSSLAIPLDGGRTVRGRRILGDNKMVRGFAVMIPASGMTFASLAWLLADATMPPAGLWSLSVSGYALLGVAAAFGFMAGELPNSFVKRQLDIAPGGTPRSRIAVGVAFVVDHVDSIVGMLAVVSLTVPTPLATWGWVLLLGPGIHLGFSVLLHRSAVKARAA